MEWMLNTTSKTLTIRLKGLDGTDIANSLPDYSAPNTDFVPKQESNFKFFVPKQKSNSKFFVPKQNCLNIRQLFFQKKSLTFDFDSYKISLADVN